MSTFHREGELSYQATAITLFPVPIFTIIYTFATTSGVFEEGMLHLINVWIEFTLGVLLPILIMLVLFLPNVSLLEYLTYAMLSLEVSCTEALFPVFQKLP